MTMVGLALGGTLVFAAPSARAADRPSGSTPGAGDETGTTTRKPVTRTVGQDVSVTATVESVDQKSRKVTLKDPEGNRETVQVPRDVQGVEKLKAGQAIDITYHEAIAITLLPAGSETPTMQEKTIGSLDVGNGHMAREITTSTTVTNVDTRSNKVTLKNADGKSRTIKVEDPDMQQTLKTVKPGDVVQVTYTEAVATTVKEHPQGKPR
jgi:hypothetical protein